MPKPDGKLPISKRLNNFATNEGCIKSIIKLLLVFITPFYGNFAFYLLWNWFIADAIHATVSYWQSAGILMTIRLNLFSG
jgi:hypothetical protein